jgi:hypothetical protein
LHLHQNFTAPKGFDAKVHEDGKIQMHLVHDVVGVLNVEPAVELSRKRHYEFVFVRPLKEEPPVSLEGLHVTFNSKWI